MLKYCISLIISLTLSSTAFTADKIHLNNGMIIDGSITQIDLESVTIKYTDQDLTRTLDKMEIKVIIYEDGTAETFQNTVAVKSEQEGARRDKFEERLTEAEITAAKNRGLMDGIGVCIVLLLLLAII